MTYGNTVVVLIIMMKMVNVVSVLNDGQCLAGSSGPAGTDVVYWIGSP